jgi:hypothetical protein
VVRKLETGEMDSKLARAMVYALSTLAGIMVQQAAQQVTATVPGLPRGVVPPGGSYKLQIEVVGEQPEPEVDEFTDRAGLLGAAPVLEEHEPTTMDDEPAPTPPAPKQEDCERRLSGFRCSVCDGLNGFAVGSHGYCADCGEPVAVPSCVTQQSAHRARRERIRPRSA